MPTVNLLVLTATGQYQRRKAQTDHQWSKHLMSHGLGQAHYLRNHPIFYDEKPVEVETLEDLRFLVPPPPSRMPRKMVALVEDNSPYCYAPEPPPIFTEQIHDHQDAYQEGAQVADIKATAELMRESMAMTLTWLATLVVSMTVLILVSIIAYNQWGPPSKQTPVPTEQEQPQVREWQPLPSKYQIAA